MKILVLDNYDSFTYNLVQLIEKVSNYEVEVRLNDKITIEEINNYNKILVSPGPGLPSEAGILNKLITTYASTKNIFGVCLGMQAIGECFGATLTNLNKVYHGIATPVKVLNSNGIFKNCASTFLAGRYHSWVVDNKNFPDNLEITAIDEQGYIMALKHKTYNVQGVQFHPESILSEYGEQIIGNWINS